MTNEAIQKLKNKIIEFQCKDIFIKLDDSIQFHTTINNAKIIVSKQKLIISDEDYQDFIIELFYLEEAEIEDNTIILELSNDLRIIVEY